MAKFAQNSVNLKCSSNLRSIGVFLVSKMMEENRTNAVISEIAIPTLIIMPSEMTGLMSHKISEKNPTIVVKMAKKHGFARSFKTA